MAESSGLRNISKNQNNLENKPIISASFSCDGGKKIKALFLNNGQSVDLSLSDGRSRLLQSDISADGGRYTNEDQTFEFWSTGQTAFIQENNLQTYSNCNQTSEQNL